MPKDLRRELLGFEPNIVHFMGHGDGVKGLFFVGDNLEQYLTQNRDGLWRVADQQQVQYVSEGAIAARGSMDLLPPQFTPVYDFRTISFRLSPL